MGEGGLGQVPEGNVHLSTRVRQRKKEWGEGEKETKKKEIAPVVRLSISKGDLIKQHTTHTNPTKKKKKKKKEKTRESKRSAGGDSRSLRSGNRSPKRSKNRSCSQYSCG